MCGIITFKVRKIYSTQPYMHDYSFGARVLAAICNAEDHKDFLDISAIDATRILRQARINNYNTNTYSMKGAMCECGKALPVHFDLKKDVQPRIGLQQRS